MAYKVSKKVSKLHVPGVEGSPFKAGETLPKDVPEHVLAGFVAAKVVVGSKDAEDHKPAASGSGTVQAGKGKPPAKTE